MRKLHLLVPVAALLAILPLLGEWPCGKDLPFHLQSWWDAAQQFRHGTLYPRWTFAASFNAGEPRFTFYPPLSWMLGGVLTLLFPFAAVPAVFTWIVLSLAGFSMYRLVAAWAAPPVALLAACVYLANPYMLYTVAMRGACGELLAAASCPLVFAAMLRSRPSVWQVGWPLALLWFSNVPGAIVGTYLFALLAAVSLLRSWRGNSGAAPELRWRALRGLVVAYGGGLVFGLCLAGVYLVPALAERRYIRMEDAYAPGMRPVDNLLLQHPLDPVRDAFLLHIAHLSAGMGAATLALLALAWHMQGGRAVAAGERHAWRRIGPAVLLTSLFTLWMLLAPAAPLWRFLPGLWVAQLPWRVLFVLGCCLALGVALVAQHARLAAVPSVCLALGAVVALAVPADRSFARAWPAGESPPALAARLSRHHTPEPTEEYVLAEADAEFMRPDNPPFWLADNPEAFAPGTTPNPMHEDPVAVMPVAPRDAALAATPLHFSAVAPRPMFLVLNLQAYPRWRVRRNGAPVLRLQPRADGLIAFAIPAGFSAVDIRWRPAADAWIGLLLTTGALATALAGRAWRFRSENAAIFGDLPG